MKVLTSKNILKYKDVFSYYLYVRFSVYQKDSRSCLSESSTFRVTACIISTDDAVSSDEATRLSARLLTLLTISERCWDSSISLLSISLISLLFLLLSSAVTFEFSANTFFVCSDQSHVLPPLPAGYQISNRSLNSFNAPSVS